MIAPETLTASYSTLPFSSCTLLTAGKLHSAVKLNPERMTVQVTCLADLDITKIMIGLYITPVLLRAYP
jgi:hypothetical protein